MLPWKPLEVSPLFFFEVLKIQPVLVQHFLGFVQPRIFYADQTTLSIWCGMSRRLMCHLPGYIGVVCLYLIVFYINLFYILFVKY